MRSQQRATTHRTPQMLRRDGWLLVGLKLLVSVLVLASGFRAISDDDYARVVLMQKWAAAPQLDPTHSSWLPFPFWVGGSAMLVFGSSLRVARITALLLAGVSAWLLYRAARLLVGPRYAFAGTFTALWLPWSAYLGASTVPEMVTAAGCVFALATVAPAAPGSKPVSPLWGAVALLPACLSRYEAWGVAGCFVLLLLWRRWRQRDTTSTVDQCRGWSAKVVWAALAVALTGPLLWLLYNAHAYRDAFRFAHRVSAYRAALHGAESGLQVWLRYPSLLLRQEPELALTAALLMLWQWRRPRALPASFGPIVCCAGLLVVALAWAAGRGGAATHHAGRALLVVWLILAIYVGAEVRRRLTTRGRAGMVVALAIILVAGVTLLRPWYGHFEDYARREGLTHFGARVSAALANRRQPHKPTVLLNAVDYGYFAIQAGSGNPALWRLDRSLDPRLQRHPSVFSSCRAWRARVEQDGFLRYAATPQRHSHTFLGQPLLSEAGWSLYAVKADVHCRSGE
ncbi:MAG TPA: hypothetical protein ENK23_07710 [Sorangium sp.]|nr:hypothetical protein [Sorangium sp.]